MEGLLAGASVRQACEWLGLGWDAAQEIMRRAVARGWERRQRDQRPHLGLDEKSCQRGHSDLPLLTDWDPSRVLAVVAERTGEAADPWWAHPHPGTESRGGSGGGGSVETLHPDDCKAGAGGRPRA